MCNASEQNTVTVFEKREFPILEYDPAPTAKIKPYKPADTAAIPQTCVITFFGEVIQQLRQANRLTQIGTFVCATVSLPIWQTAFEGQPVALVQGFLGSAGSAALLEELIAMGGKRFIVCGGAGVLQRGIQVGHLILPCAAIRDEGTSYHYAPPAREIACDPHALAVMQQVLTEEGLPFITAKTWTTDAFYRETEAKIALRVAEGCVTVEMEAAALFAVAAFRGVTLGQILFGGDDLSGVIWDARRQVSRDEIHRNLVQLAMKVCLRL